MLSPQEEMDMEQSPEISSADIRTSKRTGTAKNSSTEDLYFDYLETKDLAPKLRPEKNFEMKTFSSSLGETSFSAKERFYTRKYANNFSGQTEDPYSFENSTSDYIIHQSPWQDGRRFLSNGIDEEVSTRSIISSSDFCAQDDNCNGELEQVVVEEPRCRQVNGRVVGVNDCKTTETNPHDPINFFNESSRSAINQQESRQVATLYGPDFKHKYCQEGSLPKSNSTNNEDIVTATEIPKMICSGGTGMPGFLCSLKPNGSNMLLDQISLMLKDSPPSIEKTEMEKRIYRRNMKKETMKKKASVLRSEDIPEYKGKLPVEEIIAFIDNAKVPKIAGTVSQKITSAKYNRVKSQNVDQQDKQLSAEVTEKNKSKQSKVEQSSLVEENNKDDNNMTTRQQESMQKSNKGRQLESSDLSQPRESSTLLSSSSSSSFRTASPPGDVYLFVPEVKQVSLDVDLAAHSSTTSSQKEFIMVQKKKKLKQPHFHPRSSSGDKQAATATHFEATFTMADSPISKSSSKQPVLPANYRTKSFKQNSTFPIHNSSSSKTLLPETSLPVKQNTPSDSNNNSISTNKSTPTTTKTTLDRKTEEESVDKEIVLKQDNQFDPSQFPELSGTGRRNSTGSSVPFSFLSSSQNVDQMDSPKSFICSYADIAANLKQKAIQQNQRRGSLQLTADDLRTPNTEIVHNCNKIVSLQQDLSSSSFHNFPLDVESSDSELKESVPTCNASHAQQNFQAERNVESLKTIKTNSLCKEPVIFLDGRRNVDQSEVSDLVFIFDSSISLDVPPSKKPDMPTSASEPVLSFSGGSEIFHVESVNGCQSTCRNCKQSSVFASQDSATSPIMNEQVEDLPSDQYDLEGTSDDYYQKIPQLSPGSSINSMSSASLAYPYSRPSPLSNPYPNSRPPLVVKVSPMPIVAPANSPPHQKPIEAANVVNKNGSDISKCIEFLSHPSLIDTSRSSQLMVRRNDIYPDPHGSTGVKVSESAATVNSNKRSMFDLYRAQMFLYSGFEECMRESKTNPTNVVLYRDQ